MYAVALAGPAVSDPVILEDEAILDAAGRPTSLSTPTTIVVASPQSYRAEFDFQLPSSSIDPQSGVYVSPQLGVIWQVLDSYGVPSSVRRAAGNDVTWYAPETARYGVGVLQFNDQTGSGRARVSIPLGLELPDQVYPSLTDLETTLSLVLGLEEDLKLNQANVPVGELWSASSVIDSSVPALNVELVAASGTPTPRLSGIIALTTPTTVAKSYNLSSRVSGLAQFVPSSVEIEAGASIGLFEVDFAGSGLLTVDVIDSVTNELVGSSETLNLDLEAGDATPDGIALSSAATAAAFIAQPDINEWAFTDFICKLGSCKTGSHLNDCGPCQLDALSDPHECILEGTVSKVTPSMCVPVMGESLHQNCAFYQFAWITLNCPAFEYESAFEKACFSITRYIGITIEKSCCKYIKTEGTNTGYAKKCYVWPDSDPYPGW